ncbi:AMP-binding protein [Clostridium polynesiense]|uniref:AMP-binding protein n=1 Tax=Clostridium polynesiense TaxID=1325933 RepID=UPI0006937566|nr:AMP-binding protein [Clostridium polynesiense]
MKRNLYHAEKIRDIRTMVKRATDLYRNRTAYKEIGPSKEVLEYSFIQLEEDMNALGTALLHRGFEGKHIALLGENSYAWVVSYLAVINGVGVVIPMDKDLTDEDIAMLLNNCDADGVICSETFIPTMNNILSLCPKISSCIVMNPQEDIGDFHSLTSLIEEGKLLLKQGNREFLGAPIDVDKMSEIIFTSGTTGANKGVMLSQKNIMSVVYGAFHLIKPGKISISVLPLNHSYECSCHILGGIYWGLTVCFNDSLKNLSKNLKRFKPDFSIMVPLFLESMDKMIWKQAAENGLSGHLKYGIKFSNLIRKLGIDMRRKYFKPILSYFGGNLEQIVCGGAPLRSEIITSFDNMGINVVNGYGISECAPLVAANCTAWKKLGSVGYIVPICKVRITNKDKDGNGEIQVKGDNVMLGYYKDDKSTKTAFTEDGWFITGDRGYLDREGFLFITGRDKNLIILTNGKNVHPEELEEIITTSIPYVKEVVVTASMSKNNEDTIHAYVYFDPEYVHEKGYETLRQMIKNDIKRVNRRLALYKRISSIFVSEKEFEKTTTKKIKRQSLREEDFISA